VQFGRHDILERLIELKVNISAPDCFKRSPLFYAATRGDAMSVHLLLENGAQSNDGSLHEAARLCQKGIVAMLLQNGHDPDYACDLHGGRTALGELCFRATLASGEQESLGYDTMKLLIDSSPQFALRVKGKTVLHLTLHNDQPVEVTRALLRFPEIYNDIRTDSETFRFEDSRKISMSPDRYVTEYCKCSQGLKDMLIDLLEKKQCKEKWFKKNGEQLDDCKGLPQGLKEAMDQQDIADQAELRAIRRRQLSANADLKIENVRHKARMLQSKEQTDANLYNTQRINEQQLAHDNALSTQRRKNTNLDRADERHHLEQKNQLEYSSIERKKQLEFTTQQRHDQLEYSSIERKKQLEFTSQQRHDQQRYMTTEREASLEKRLIESRDEAEKRSLDRAMHRFERQDKSIMLAANQQRALIEAARAAKVSASSSPLALTQGNESFVLD
jgi:ankyrin repeat domain-containing protein 50